MQVVTDLLAEVDRLRGKLEMAGLARDLAGRAAATLRDACDDVVAAQRRQEASRSEGVSPRVRAQASAGDELSSAAPRTQASASAMSRNVRSSSGRAAVSVSAMRPMP